MKLIKSLLNLIVMFGKKFKKSKFGKVFGKVTKVAAGIAGTVIGVDINGIAAEVKDLIGKGAKGELNDKLKELLLEKANLEAQALAEKNPEAVAKIKDTIGKIESLIALIGS